MAEEKLEAAKATAKGYLKTYLEGRGWKRGDPCPVCGHKGCFGIYEGGLKWKCQSAQHGGESGGDIFDLYAQINGVGTGEAMKQIFTQYGIDYADKTFSPSGGKQKKEAAGGRRPMPPPPPPPSHTMSAEEKARAVEAFRKEIEEAQKGLEAPEAVAYLEGRGLTLELARGYGLGYVAKWVHPKARKAPTAQPSPRLIIPSGYLRYTARDIRKPEEIPEAERNDEYYAPKKQATAYTGAEALFNEGALEEAGIWGGKPLYVVEGELDALSIIAAGGLAVGLNSVGRVGWLLKKLEELDRRFNDGLRKDGVDLDFSWEAWKPRVVIALDADKAGEEAARTLSDGLRRLGVECLREDAGTLYGGSKDANEALVADAEGFSARLATSLEAYEARKKALSHSIEAEYRAANSAAGYMDAFRACMMNSADAIPTCFPKLDLLLSGDAKAEDRGGLMEGLYILGAPSSCGKTTFALQLADSVAAGGRDALIFSLEMSRAELIARSISRYTYQIASAKIPKAEEAKAMAKTSYGVIKGKRANRYSEAERSLIIDAMTAYEGGVASHIFIREGKPEGWKVTDIRAAVAEHIAKTGTAPLVVVDYLQMIAPSADRLTDKQTIDFNVLALKNLSREYRIPVLAISAYNRDSYTAGASVEAMKGSGAIEYSADIVITLSYQNASTAERGESGKGKAKAEQKEESRKPERDIRLEVLKNRNGSKGEILYHYYALFNTFKEFTEAETISARRFGGLGGKR